MKRIITFIFILTFLIVPLNATTVLTTYDNTKKSIKNYINSFNNYDKFIINDSEIPFIYKNNKVTYSSDFNGNSGILNEEEYKIGMEYLYNGLNFWIISNDSNKYLEINSSFKTNNFISNSKNNSYISGIRPTIFTKSNARVSGDGSRYSPWEFSNNRYFITLNTENATVDESELSVLESEIIQTTVTPISGYVFESLTCTNDQNVTYDDGKIIIGNMTDDTVCDIKFIKIDDVIPSKDGEYVVPIDGYYLVEACGAQGSGSGGKGGCVSVEFYLLKGQTISYRLGTTTNGAKAVSGSGVSYAGGGSTRVKINGTDAGLIAAGGGGGKNGGSGGIGDGSGGVVTVSNTAGNSGTNGDGGSSATSYTVCTSTGTCGGQCTSYTTKETKTCVSYAPTNKVCAKGETECGDMFCDQLTGFAKSQCFLTCGSAGGNGTGTVCQTSGGECLSYNTTTEKVCSSYAATYTCCTSTKTYSGNGGQGGHNGYTSKVNGMDSNLIKNTTGEKTSNGSLKISYVKGV